MRRILKISNVLLAGAALAGSAYAQSIISAHSGLIHYAEGSVLLGDKPVEIKYGKFPEMKENGVLRTEEGRAEVLLSPGEFYSGLKGSLRDMAPSEGLATFLRVGENSAVKLISNRLSDTRLEFLSGDILVECAEIVKGNKVTLVYKDHGIDLHKNGLYRLSGDPALIRVYKGEATVNVNGQSLLVKDGRQMVLNGLLIAEKFNSKIGDPLYRWSKRRSEYLAVANVSSAKGLLDRGWSNGWSGWRWNPYFGMFTFIPARGMYLSPFGCYFYAPRAVYRVYYQPPPQVVSSANGGGGFRGPSYNPNLGYSTVSRSDSGSYSGPVSSSAPAASSASSSPRGGEASSPRDSGSSGSRGK